MKKGYFSIAKPEYGSPVLELISLQVEKGFAQSGRDTEELGFGEDWTLDGLY